jgi:Asp-tRNA(Asn)/Glu-tRNA(Gln) amidotransferase A subunit family amidase
MSALYLNHSIPELLSSIERGNLTLIDLASEVEKQIIQTEPSTFCWVSYDLESLKEESKRAHSNYMSRGRLLPLDGIPFGVKDIFNTKQYPTEMGSKLWKNFTPGNNARVVDSVIGSGGLVVGKTVTAEFAVHALNETLNPHNRTRTPGTSSSGSAAAVATGMIPFALATQTAGSIVRPASFCGTWGMKPSFGIIPRTGVLKTTDSLDTIGFFAAHGESLRTILDVVRVKGPDYPYVYRNVDKKGPYPKQLNRPWRVGFVRTHTWGAAESYVKHSIEIFVNQIASQVGFDVEEINWPFDLERSHKVHETIYNKSISYYFINEFKSRDSISPLMASMILKGGSISETQYKSALIDQELYCREIDLLFKDYDFVVSLATSSSAPARGAEETPDPSLIWTLGHLPCIVAPAFRCPNGLPIGAQFTARRWSDYTLIQGVEELITSGVLMKGSLQIIPNLTKQPQL